MGIFQHTPDDIINVDGLRMDLTFFLTQEPTYALPTTDVNGNTINCTNQEYLQGSYHYLWDAVKSTQYGGVYPWADGNTYISKKLIYQDNLYPPQTLDEAKDQKISELRQYATQYYSGGVSISSVIYSSAFSFLTKIENEFKYFDHIGSLPMGYYVYDIDHNRISFTLLSDLATLMYKILELHYQVKLNFDDHYDAIMALTTIPDVESYVFTGGWPTVPYV